MERRYFAGQLNPYEHDSLIAVAVETGLDRDLVRGVLTGDSHAGDVRRDEAAGRGLGITGVPFVLLDQRSAIAGRDLNTNRLPPSMVAPRHARSCIEG